jgi:hypothetical protein
VKPRRSVLSNVVFRLGGGNEDNDLWIHQDTDADGNPILRSVWVPTEQERIALADPDVNVELIVWGTQHSPVLIQATDVELRGSDVDPDDLERMFGEDHPQ